MAVLLITCEQHTPLKDYKPLYDAIKLNSVAWWHYLEHVWIVNTTKTADEYARLLYPHITNNDRLFVAKLTGEHQGWLVEDAWKWLNNQIY